MTTPPPVRGPAGACRCVQRLAVNRYPGSMAPSGTSASIASAPIENQAAAGGLWTYARGEEIAGESGSGYCEPGTDFRLAVPCKSMSNTTALSASFGSTRSGIRSTMSLTRGTAAM